MSGAPVHDRAVIVSTGDEIVLGQLLDTNSRYLAERLTSLGVVPIEHVSVPDDTRILMETLRRACRAAPLVIMSGGLGPTDGDLTRAALSEVLGEPLVVDEQARRALAAMLASRGREMSDRQERQALRPRSARCLPNRLGTAPGLHAVAAAGAHGSADVFCLPGPPGELRPMFEECVVPALRLDPGRVVITRLLHVVGIAEAECVSRLGDLTRRDRTPLVGVTASGGILTIRIRLEGTSEGGTGRAAAERLVDGVEAQVRLVLGEHVIGIGPEPGAEVLSRIVLAKLEKLGQTLSVVESCTGGMLGEMLTEIPGSSRAFLGGVIVYSDSAKVELGVNRAKIAASGSVSEPVCREMAAAGLARFKSTRAVAITGIAGPDGGSAQMPVGTVYIACARRGEGGAEAEGMDVRRFHFPGDREDVRRRACVSALAMLHFGMLGQCDGLPRLLWQGT